MSDPSWIGGCEEGPLVVFLHGCPDTRHVAMTGHRAAAAVGVRLLCVNRPGYGAAPARASTQGSVADDLVAVARGLGHERFAVLGMSVGCSYALAVAARHPDRVAALGLVSPQAPDHQPGTVAQKVERFRPGFQQYVAALAPGDPDDAALADRFLAQLPSGDATRLRAMVGPGGVAAGVREALASPEGYLRDAALLLSPWDHAPEEVSAPTYAWVGELDDRAAPATWTRRFGDVTRVTHAATTHLATLLAHWPGILGTLHAHLGD